MEASDQLQNILIVVNPISGDIEKEDLEEKLSPLCKPHGLRCTYFMTTGEDDERKIKEKIDELQVDAVVAAGGDGTVNLVAKVLNHSPIPLGILPLGSGNGLSKDLNIPQDLEEAFNLLAQHRINPIDTLEINGHWSFHLSDLGFNALVVKRFSEGETRGPGAYAWIAMQEYLNYQPKTYRVETDTENFEGPAFMLTIANAKAFGSNAAINPSGVVDDGWFEVCIMEPFPKAAALGILYSLYTDSIHLSDYTRRIQCSRATIYNFDSEVAHVDGEPVELGEKIEVRIFPKSLRMLLPPKGQDLF